MNAAPLVAAVGLGAYLAWRQGQGQGAAIVDDGAPPNIEPQTTWADDWTGAWQSARDAMTGQGDTAPMQAIDTVPTDDDEQETTTMKDIQVSMTTWGQGSAAESVDHPNVRAFLDMLATAEGTAGPDGYRTMFGGATFDSYADHPRKVFAFKNSRGQSLTTTAAGRYQFLARTWDSLKSKLGLQDFGPRAQDVAAVELIRQRGALGDIKAGRIVAAIGKCAPVWASLPGAGYAQPERKQSDLIAAYQGAGGQVLTA